jgi:cyclopropane fatty-acyl-phospholipid synthase-like methyltransferase
VINAFVADKNIKSVIEFGCGDGNQLTLAKYSSYLGMDVSESAVQRCRKVFEADPTKSFEVIDNYKGQKADLALSLDVIYHVVEDSAFEQYLRTLFAAAERYVIIYSSDSTNNRGFGNTYIKHRNFTQTVQREFPDWKLIQRIPNKYPWRGDYKTSSFCDFFIYERS